MNSPLQLDRYHLVSAHLEATGLDRPTGRQDVHVQVTAGHQRDNERAWRIELTVEFGGREEPCAPFRGSVRMEGFFTVHPEFPTERIDALARVNAAAILYGAIREVVSNLTARSKAGIYVLPSISFLNIIEKKPAAAGDVEVPDMKQVP